ncbi:hypothetical protein DCC81_16925 [Chitinophaga parva]|uniref:Uncharacterized protein n=1 Tax=Chitinophaga parva TaxID=2169414 RepID=A0A2T7BI21_9BACT|nr:hypothetical protein [Chitinophaga parva]PUZ25929.1 hypothetical protein DCC81_16925 [Chitinophaga parva]
MIVFLVFFILFLTVLIPLILLALYLSSTRIEKNVIKALNQHGLKLVSIEKTSRTFKYKERSSDFTVADLFQMNLMPGVRSVSFRAITYLTKDNQTITSLAAIETKTNNTLEIYFESLRS